MKLRLYRSLVYLLVTAMIISGCGPLVQLGGDQVTISIVYGSEKEDWLEPLVEEFNQQKHKTESGSAIVVESTPMGSIESADAIVAGDSAAYRLEPGLLGVYSYCERRVAQISC